MMRCCYSEASTVVVRKEGHGYTRAWMPSFTILFLKSESLVQVCWSLKKQIFWTKQVFFFGPYICAHNSLFLTIGGVCWSFEDVAFRPSRLQPTPLTGLQEVGIRKSWVKSSKHGVKGKCCLARLSVPRGLSLDRSREHFVHSVWRSENYFGCRLHLNTTIIVMLDLSFVNSILVSEGEQLPL